MIEFLKQNKKAIYGGLITFIIIGIGVFYWEISQATKQNSC